VEGHCVAGVCVDSYRVVGWIDSKASARKLNVYVQVLLPSIISSGFSS
jgi:hypothetical protein